MKTHFFCGLVSSMLVLALLGSVPAQAYPISVDGLQAPTQVIRDVEGIPHIYAQSERDAYFLLGYFHAQERFFAMDYYRRAFGGTLAEIFGAAALGSDIQLRGFNLRGIAATTFATLPAGTQAWMQAYSDGINAYLASGTLPVEYSIFELTHNGIPAWQPEDSLVIWSGFALGSWMDLSDADRTFALAAFEQQANGQGFDPVALFTDDVFRNAPMVSEISIPPGQGQGGPLSAGNPLMARARQQEPADFLRPETLDLIARYRESVQDNPLLKEAFDQQSTKGSNWWLVSGAHTANGAALLANDPHQPVTMPTILYEAHLVVRGHGQGQGQEDLNVNAATFPGVPGLVVGCSTFQCWGATNSRHDVSDIFQELVVIDPQTGEPTHTIYQGQREPLVTVDFVFRANQVGDGVPDNVVTVPVAPLDGGRGYYVPRRNNGPLLTLVPVAPDQGVGLSVQYVGWSPSLDMDGLRDLPKAHSPAEFSDAVQRINLWILNYSYADILGNIAYRVSGTVPLRDDLENLGAPDGPAPYFIRDGSGTLRHEWLPVTNPQPHQTLPYEILPAAEMPQSVNPAQGYLVSANNDPIGTTADNDPLNQFRATGGVYYLNYSHAFGLRASRIRRLLEAELAADGSISAADAKVMQANNQMLDAELLVPFILQAFADASNPGAPAELTQLAAEARIAEAVGRLAAWDFSTPTGIPEGYDPGDDPANLPQPSADEIAHSIAATLYSVWRGQAIGNVIDATLDSLNLGGFRPDSRVALADLANLLFNFSTNQGVGASGVNFFEVPGVSDPEAARDILMLRSLGDALDLLAGDAFAPAFNHSTQQADYRWGILHRLKIGHLIVPSFSVPPAGGYQDLSAQLPGLARASGYETVDSGSHDARAASANAFMFTVPPGRRGVASLKAHGVDAVQILPGGQSGDPLSPYYTNQMDRYLTNQYAPVALERGDVNRIRVSQETYLPAH